MSIISKSKFGIGGFAGIIVSTIVLELATQLIRNNVPQSQQVLDAGLPTNQFGFSANVRDLIVFSPTIQQLLKLVKGGKPNIMFILANVGTKAFLRGQGINPLPDKQNPHVSKTKNFSYQLAMP